MVKISRKSIKKGSRDAKKAEKEAKKQTKKKAEQGKRVELNSKELKVNLEQLQKDVKKAYGSMLKLVPESIKDAKVKRFGNASHIILPKEYAGKKAMVIIKKPEK